MTPATLARHLAARALLAAAAIAWRCVPPRRRVRAIERVEVAWLLSDDARLGRLLGWLCERADDGLEGRDV